MNAKVRGGLAGAAMAVVVFAGVAVASSGGDEPRLEQSTVGAPDTETVETTTTTTVAPSTTVDEAPVETTAAPVETTVVATTAAPTSQPPATTEAEVEMVAVPQLEANTQNIACDRLAAAGLACNVVYEERVGGEKRRVVAVSPAPGTEVAVGSTVTITVGV